MKIVDEQSSANKTLRAHGLSLNSEGHPQERRQIQE